MARHSPLFFGSCGSSRKNIAALADEAVLAYPDGVAAPTAPPAPELWALDGVMEALGAER
jgi:hypothetical protein